MPPGFFFNQNKRFPLYAVPFRRDRVGDLSAASALRARRGNYAYNIGDWGSLGYFGGKPATMKTTMIQHLAAAGLAGKEILGFEFDLGDRCIIWADGEQPENQFNGGQLNILDLAGKEYDNRLIAHRYSSIIDPVERRNNLYSIIAKHRKELGLIVLDGVANFMVNSNDGDETKLITSRFNKIAIDFSCIGLFVNHLTEKADKSTKLYGTSGTEIDKIATWGFITMQQGKYFGLTKGKFRQDKSPPNLWMTNQNKKLITEPYFPY